MTDKMFFTLFISIAALISAAIIYNPNPAPVPIARTGVASWYSEKSTREERNENENAERKMANGKIFDDSEMLAASWDYDFDTELTVENLKNGKTVRVTVTDRGPCRRLYKEGRIIDLARSAFAKIADLDEGLIDVCITKARGEK